MSDTAFFVPFPVDNEEIIPKIEHLPDLQTFNPNLAAEPVGDIEKLFAMWDQWGWHRVTFYGDLKKPLYALAGAMGWKIVEEA